jgi:hypothetical protein
MRQGKARRVKPNMTGIDSTRLTSTQVLALVLALPLALPLYIDIDSRRQDQKQGKDKCTTYKDPERHTNKD